MHFVHLKTLFWKGVQALQDYQSDPWIKKKKWLQISG